MRVLVLLLLARALALSPSLEGVANFREVSPLLPGVYRSAELERATDDDALDQLDQLDPLDRLEQLDRLDKLDQLD